MPETSTPAATLTDSERVALIRRVLSTAYEKTESFTEFPELAAELAYLAMAITEPDRSLGFVDWSEPGKHTYTLVHFALWFPADDPVWQFIETEDSRHG